MSLGHVLAHIAADADYQHAVAELAKAAKQRHGSPARLDLIAYVSKQRRVRYLFSAIKARLESQGLN